MSKTMKKILLVLVMMLACVTAVAVFRLQDQEEVPENSIVLMRNGEERAVSLEELQITEVAGTVVNGKGEEKAVEGKGISLGELLGDEAYEVVTVTADDAYSAEIRGDENADAWLVVQEDTVHLYVFNDSNSKRNVKNVAVVEVK